jgi:hypothetical protein
VCFNTPPNTTHIAQGITMGELYGENNELTQVPRCI